MFHGSSLPSSHFQHAPIRKISKLAISPQRNMALPVGALIFTKIIVMDCLYFMVWATANRPQMILKGTFGPIYKRLWRAVVGAARPPEPLNFSLEDSHYGISGSNYACWFGSHFFDPQISLAQTV